ncbi:MAG: hypothetical protein FGM34_09885 [Solirubrobacteraceae bacterium]|nr:hypothetical protein [Solirubrobacteraceae bacterium]
MTLLSRIVFGLLVVAAAGAFFIAQRLKSAPPVVQGFRLSSTVFSPNGDGRLDRERVSFLLKRGETVDVAVVNDQGDPVRELASGLQLRAYSRSPVLTWDGRDQDGRVAPDGRYRIRITLRREGRSIVVRESFLLDDTPPEVAILSIGPRRGAGPEPITRPGRERIRIRWRPGVSDGRLLVFRTDPRPVKLVYERPLAARATKATWNGTTTAGRPVTPGTYLAVVERRDAAGVAGTSTPLDAKGLPVLPYGRRLQGRGGIAVQPVGVVPPLVATPVGRRVAIGVVAGGRPYDWAMGRLGGKAQKSGSASRRTVNVKPAAENSGVFLFSATRGAARAGAPFAVDDRASHPVLVVMPVISWQGRNPVDANGDGRPELLADGLPASVRRPLVGRLPSGFASSEQPVMAWLTRTRKRFDITTDYAIARNVPPLLAGHRGVLLAGSTSWLPVSAQRRLRRFVRAGGTLVQVAPDSLQRTVTLGRSGVLTRPLPPATADVFGSEIESRSGKFTVTNSRDAIDLFGGTEGLFRGYTRIEETVSPGRAKVLSSAVTDDGRVVVVALKVGRGTVIRFGLPELPGRLGSDPDAQGLMERSWQLMSR